MNFEEILEKLNFASKSSFKRLLKFAERTDCLDRYSELKDAMGRTYIRDELSMSDLVNLMLQPDQLEELIE